ncbi:MAG: TonB-dependent receptor [Rhodocyclaceae bacterium]
MPASFKLQDRARTAARFNRTTLSVAVGLVLSGHAMAQEAPGAVQQLPTITVTGTAPDETIEHLKKPVSSGALGDRSQLETPFSTTVVTRTDLDERQVNRLGDLFATDASVTDTSGANTAWASYLTVRGMQLDWQNSFRIDGRPFLAYATTLPYELFDSVELLKGASGFMYGFGSPGGVVNYVTKKPTDEPVRSVNVGYQSDSIIREHADLGGRAGPDGRIGYRLNVSHAEGGLTNDGNVNSNAASLALDARLTNKLTWDFQSIYQKRKVSGGEPTIYTGRMGNRLPSPVRNDDSTLVGGGVFLDNEFNYYATGLTYLLTPNWTLRANVSHSSTQTRRNESVLALIDGEGNYQDFHSDYAERYNFDQAQATAEGRFTTGPLVHQVVLGGAWQKQRNDYASNSFYQLIGSGSIYEQNTNSYYSDGGLDLYRAVTITQKSLFASDTVKFAERWSVLGGLRYTDYTQDLFGVNGGRTGDYNKNAVTPTLAVMYDVAPSARLYASYVEALEQGSTVGTSFANRGAQLDPLESKQYEVGLKIDRNTWAATTALFRVERGAEYTNANNELVQDGKSLFQGLELGASANVARNWTVGGNLMWLDTEYQKGTAFNGNRVAGAPKFTATAQVAYRVPYVPGLKLRADAKYTGSTMLRPANDVKVGGYALFNLGASYDTLIARYATTFRVTLNNVTNKRYWAFQYADYVKAGDPRTLALSATVNF